MKVTISEPTPVPEMPRMFVVTRPCANTIGGWSCMPWGTLEVEAKRDRDAYPNARLIIIDPSAPSFEPGPLEWTSDGCAVEIKQGTNALSLNIDSELQAYVCPNSKSHIQELIRALVTAYHAAPENL